MCSESGRVDSGRAKVVVLFLSHRRQYLRISDRTSAGIVFKEVFVRGSAGGEDVAVARFAIGPVGQSDVGYLVKNNVNLGNEPLIRVPMFPDGITCHRGWNRLVCAVAEEQANR